MSRKKESSAFTILSRTYIREELIYQVAINPLYKDARSLSVLPSKPEELYEAIYQRNLALAALIQKIYEIYKVDNHSKELGFSWVLIQEAAYALDMKALMCCWLTIDNWRLDKAFKQYQLPTLEESKLMYSLVLRYPEPILYAGAYLAGYISTVDVEDYLGIAIVNENKTASHTELLSYYPDLNVIDMF